MKVLHISKTDRGGAANAALRLHTSLINNNIDSKFLVADKSRNDIGSIVEVALPLSKAGCILHKLLSFISSSGNCFKYDTEKIEKLKKALCSYLKQKRQQNSNYSKIAGKKLDCEIYTFPQSDYRLWDLPEVKQADIINLHWTGSFLDWPSFFKCIEKPVVWTLHDMNPFMGGFHYTGDLKKNYEKMISLENELIGIKKTALASTKDLTIVSPSKWLKSESEKSLIFKNFRHLHIPYGLPTQIFRPFERNLSKNVLNIPLNGKTLLFVAADINNHRKGFSILIEAISKLIDSKINLAIIGNGQFDSVDIQCQHLGFISDERLLALAYSAADQFIIPSMEDNLPNTVLESLSCGTPVVGFNIGGLSDMISNGVNGVLADDINSAALARAIETALTTNFDNTLIRKNAEIKYDANVQAKRYIELYQELREEYA